MGGGLYDPLGAGLPDAQRRRLSVPVVATGIVVAALLVFAIAVAVRSGGERGEPRAIVTIDRSVTPSPALPPAMPPPSQAAPVPPAGAAPPVSAAAEAVGSSDPVRDADVAIENGVRIVRMRPPEPAQPSGQGGAAPRAVPASRSLPAAPAAGH